MMRPTLKHWMNGIAVSAALVIQAAVPAFADPPTTERAPEVLPLRLPQARAVDLDPNGGWLRRSFHIQKKSGFAYTQQFVVSERPIIFRIQGPVMREQKALGLTLKIRF